jgi:hypothetical protein
MQNRCVEFANLCNSRSFTDRMRLRIQTIIVEIEDQESFTFDEMIGILSGFQNYRGGSSIKPNDDLKQKLIECAQAYVDTEIDKQASDAFKILKFSRGVIELGVGILRPLLLVCTRRRQHLVNENEFDELCKDRNLKEILRETVFTQFPLDNPQFSDRKLLDLLRNALSTMPETEELFQDAWPRSNNSRQTVPHVVELEPAGISDIALASVQQRSGCPREGVRVYRVICTCISCNMYVYIV